jgi:flagellar hook protein FlgE
LTRFKQNSKNQKTGGITMSLTSAMFTGVSGLLNQAEAMNVIGNNIANVNTVGFKGARTLFSDVLSTSLASNGSQIGHGVQLQKIDNLFTQSSFESTGNVADLAIQGDSFFALKDPNLTGAVSQNNALLTRAGAFRLDNTLTLVNADGYQVLDTQGNAIKFSDNAAAIATINAALTTQSSIPAGIINTQAAAQVIAATTFANGIYNAAATALSAQAGIINGSATTFQGVAGGTASEAAAQQSILTAATAAQTAATVATGAPTANNVAAAQAAFDSLNRLTTASTFTTPGIITAFNTFKASLATVNTANATNAPPAEIASANAILAAAGAAQSAATTASNRPTPASIAAAQTSFNALTNLTNSSNFTAPAFVTVYNTFSGTQNPANTTVDSAMATAAPLITAGQAQLAAAEGAAFGKITNIDPSGLITYLGKDGITTNYYNTSGQVGVVASLTNATGVQRMATVNVANQGGLEKAGGTLFRATTASGVPATAFSLASNTANGSSEKISQKNLENSNVDMANEFVKMIQTQRAYSAGSKVITTSDEMTQEVLNLKR